MSDTPRNAANTLADMLEEMVGDLERVLAALQSDLHHPEDRQCEKLCEILKSSSDFRREFEAIWPAIDSNLRGALLLLKQRREDLLVRLRYAHESVDDNLEASHRAQALIGAFWECV